MKPIEVQLRWLLRPLQRWLDEPEITDVFINGPDRIFVKQCGRTTRLDLRLEYDDLIDIGINAAALMHQDIGEDVPLCSTCLPDGQRVQLIQPPAVADGQYSISIRRPAPSTPTLDELDQSGVFSQAKFAGHTPSPIDRQLAEIRALHHACHANGGAFGGLQRLEHLAQLADGGVDPRIVVKRRVGQPLQPNDEHRPAGIDAGSRHLDRQGSSARDQSKLVHRINRRCAVGKAAGWRRRG